MGQLTHLGANLVHQWSAFTPVVMRLRTHAVQLKRGYFGLIFPLLAIRGQTAFATFNFTTLLRLLTTIPHVSPRPYPIPTFTTIASSELIH